MKSLDMFAYLLDELQQRIFQMQDTAIALRFARGRDEDRQTILAQSPESWEPVGQDLVWGEPWGYFWFSGKVTIPAELAGKRLFLYVDAQFGSTMGRSDPQCLLRVNGKIAQGADGNHREMLLTEQAQAGECFDILVEAGTIEDRRQCGIALKLMVHDEKAEALYYDLRVPFDVARTLDKMDPRRYFLLNCISEALDVLDLRQGNEARFQASVAKASEIAARIYDAEDFGEKPVITVTGHTHIDVAWLWRVRDTRQKMARSMATALKLMDEYPDYRFMYNQGVLLDYLSKDYPELFERLNERFKAEQFEIEGAFWLEPDANITSGESFIRHIQHGIRYHKETYGVRPRILWLPDTFGYSAALPQIMAQSGIEVFVTHKLSWNDTNKMPYETFHWQGIDGTRVPAYFLTTQPHDSKEIGTTYCPNLKATHVVGTWTRHSQKELNKELFLVYGHGDGGGGPTREMLEHIRRMERGIPGCPAVNHGTMGGFFTDFVARMKANPDAFPTWVGELYLEFHRGTLTSVAKNKRNNQKAEQSLRQLEALASYGFALRGTDYPTQRLHDLWRVVMLNQFHDILPGSSIGEVYEDSDREYKAFFEEAERLHDELIGAIAPATGSAVLFNPLGQAIDALVMTNEQAPQEIVWQGRTFVTQTIHRASGKMEQAARFEDIPALCPLSVDMTAVGASQVSSGEDASGALVARTDRLENDTLCVLFNDKGRITSILDKRLDREVLLPGQTANRLQAYRDLPPQYDAWDIDASFEDQSWDIDELVSAEVVETGPYRVALRLVWRYETSTVTQIVALEAGSARIDFDCHIDWHEHNTLVKAAFPLDIATSESNAAIQFGHVKRPTHQNTSWDQARFESLMHRWVDLSEPDFGVALLNDCKYGYDAKGTTLRLTLLRSPTYPWPQSDQGAHHFRYGLMVHHGLLADGGVPMAAEIFSQTFRLTAVTEPRPKLETSLSSLVSVQGEGVTLETVKKAEEGNALIVRLWESFGCETNVTLSLPDPVNKAVAVNLLEEEEAELSMQDQELALDFKPFEIKSIKLLLAGS
ncbi:glycoside hydrolase family 38 C-terminal domain-containing protein [uncultured Cohaesibacter sp.]|uniref:alpha-mannosidase n=1 Tax=uncultured Cohaesibacter sp. TaxID=1002546 RepID=UPI00292F6892|nr:glycoside hydrolase family 38 C-terminal domain-containing protein [uncultured Cohaesibacter sp.]